MNSSDMPIPKPTASANSFVTLHYRIRLAENQEVIVSTFEDKPATLEIGMGQLAEGLEKCVIGMEVGQRKVFEIEAKDGYGDKNPTLYRPVTKKLLNQYAEADTTFEPGEYVHFPAPDGGQFAGTVVEDQGDAILFDFNHPLAGRRLVFEVQLIGVL